MQPIIEHTSGVKFFPFCPQWVLDDYQGCVRLNREDGTHTYANYYCPSDMNPYIGQGLYYKHHEKPAFLTRLKDMFCMGTKEELENLLKTNQV